MAEFDFTKGKKNVVDAITEATATQAPAAREKRKRTKREYTREEREAYITSMTTSGRKGVKMPRVNIPITPENLAYVKTMGRVTGDGMGSFINWVIHQHLQDHTELYNKAKEFQKALDED